LIKRALGDFPKDGEVSCGVAVADPTFVFSKSDVKDLMKAVFDGPMVSDGGGESQPPSTMEEATSLRPAERVQADQGFRQIKTLR
jgi:hypothetical protein